jgi:hypothetical protein
MRRRHFLFVILAATLCPLCLSASQAGRPESNVYLATSASLTLSHNPLTLGQPLTLTGKVSAAGRPVTVGTMEIQMAESPEGPWTVLEGGQPGPDGRFQTVEFALGQECRPFYVRVRYLGHEAGRVCYREAVSPALPLVVRTAACRDEALTMGFVQAGGEGAPGRQGSGPWEFVIKVRAAREADQVMFQGKTSDWLPLMGAALDFQADAGQVSAEALEGGCGGTQVSWRLGSLKAGEEATLRVRVDGIIFDDETGCDTALPFDSIGAATLLTQETRRRVPLLWAVRLAGAFPAGEQ